MTAEVKASDSPSGWIVVTDAGKASEPVHRVREAVQHARRLVQLGGGGQVLVRSRSGALVESQTVPTRSDGLVTRSDGLVFS